MLDVFSPVALTPHECIINIWYIKNKICKGHQTLRVYGDLTNFFVA